MNIVDLEEYIKERGEQLRWLFTQNSPGKSFPNYVCVEDFVAKYGMAFGDLIPVPDNVERGQKRECFANSTLGLVRSGGEYAYCEGIAVGRELGFPVHHAWLVDDMGQVIDPTWDYGPGDAFYYGIPFEEEFAMAKMVKTGYYGLICPGEMFDRDLFDGVDQPQDFLHPWFANDILAREKLEPVT